ncbi:MAG: FHA domain-containing protein, partial [Planctomycetota bacterium]
MSHSGAISIGRESANHIQLRDNEASRRHAEVSRVGEFFVICDLNSSNGTFVNKQKIEKAELSSGDQLQIGRTLLVYSGDTEELDS